MATISATTDSPAAVSGVGLTIITWGNLGTGDDGNWIDISNYSDFTLQVKGTFSGATCTVQGSNDSGTTGNTLTDLDASSMALTTADMRTIRESPQMMRPVMSGGDVNTDVTVILVGKR